MGLLTSRQWAIVIRNNDRSRILDIVETQGFDGVEDYFRVKEVAVSNQEVAKRVKQTADVQTEARFRIEKISKSIDERFDKKKFNEYLIPKDLLSKVEQFNVIYKPEKWSVKKDF